MCGTTWPAFSVICRRSHGCAPTVPLTPNLLPQESIAGEPLAHHLGPDAQAVEIADGAVVTPENRRPKIMAPW